MRRMIGLFGSWAVLVLALGLATIAVAGEVMNQRTERRLNRVEMIDSMIAERVGDKATALRQTTERQAAEIAALQTRLVEVAKRTEDQPDTDQTIVISTAENKLYLRKGRETIFQAICSTGKGTKLAVDGKTLVFDTPIGKFQIISKEENPVWVPPDWHYIEQARKYGMRVVRLNHGDRLDADTGGPVRKAESSFFSWFGDSSPGTTRVLRVRGNSVVVEGNGYSRELPPGEMIYAGGAVVIPPIGSPQRKFEHVLGHYRLNLGDGYAIHGTMETSKLGRSVSHGCVRLGEQDIERLFQMAKVGDEVVIY